MTADPEEQGEPNTRNNDSTTRGVAETLGEADGEADDTTRVSDETTGYNQRPLAQATTHNTVAAPGRIEGGHANSRNGWIRQ